MTHECNILQIEDDEITKYEKKKARAIRLLQNIPLTEGPVEISYSGGKDSDVILELVKMAGIPYRAIYKCTTIDPPGTIKHCKEKGAEIIMPKKTFFKLVEENGQPSRFARFCCSKLKEYKILDRAIQGIRRSESIKRAKRYKEPEICRVYGKNSKAKIYLPILDWTDADVARFIDERNIKCHPLYYDDKGKFRVERRLGCIGCPLQSDNGKRDFLKYPKMLKLAIKSHQKWIKNHPNNNTCKRFRNSYEVFYFRFFCKTYKQFSDAINNHIWGGQEDTKKFLEDYFKIDL